MENTEKVEQDNLSKEGRIIIRNLPYDIKENHLRKDFAKYGKIENISVPLNN
jgi:RNA recognition motif-containing protein